MRAARYATAAAVVLTVALTAALALPRLERPSSVGPSTSQGRVGPPAASSSAASEVPPTPERPSGRFTPTWLPDGLRIATEAEGLALPTSPAHGWSRTYVRPGSTVDDREDLTVSLQTGAPSPDIDGDITRYAGSRRVDVQGHPALLLPAVAGRDQPSLSWSPGPGLLAQVQGFGVSDDDLVVVAAGFHPPPALDATTLPEGFSELQRSDADAFPAPIPRSFTTGTAVAHGPVPSPGSPAVVVTATWDRPPPTAHAVAAVRGHPAVQDFQGADTTLTWTERPGLTVTVTGTNLAVDQVREIAERLREESVDEVLARQTGERVVLATGQAGGQAYELRSFGSPSGPCLQLSYGWTSLTCGGGPTGRVADLAPSISLGVAFGPVVTGTARVRLELGDGPTVETDTVGEAAGQGAAFYVALLPQSGRVTAVVALGAGGEVLRRTPVG